MVAVLGIRFELPSEEDEQDPVFARLKLGAAAPSILAFNAVEFSVTYWAAP